MFGSYKSERSPTPYLCIANMIFYLTWTVALLHSPHHHNMSCRFHNYLLHSNNPQ